MKLAVIGSSTFNDYTRLKMTLSVHDVLYPITALSVIQNNNISLFVDRFASESRIPFIKASTDANSSAYAPIRDIIMACDKVYAFWDMKSAGTGHFIELTKKLGKPIRIVSFS